MSTLVVIGCDGSPRGARGPPHAGKDAEGFLTDLEGAVVVIKDKKGKVKLHQAAPPIANKLFECGMIP